MNERARPRLLALALNSPRSRAVGALSLIAVGLIAVLGIVLARTWSPRAYRVEMLVDLIPNRALLAEQIAAKGKEHGLEVVLSSRPRGSLEAIELIDRPNPLDAALVPGGVTRRAYPNVRQVLAVGTESLHLLVRAELAEERLARLKGRRINLGPTSASCHYLARDILAFAGLRAPVGPAAAGSTGDYDAEEASPQELRRQLARFRAATGADRDRLGRGLPDAVFVLSTLPSTLARELIATAGYRLVSLPFADAYCLDRVTPSVAGEATIDRAAVFATEIPACLYGVDPPMPGAPCRTIGMRLLLLAYAATDAEAVARMIETVVGAGLTSPGDPIPLRDPVRAFPIHSGTELYLRRRQPLLSPERAGSLGTLGGVLGAFALGTVVAYCYFRFRQLRRFDHYYREVRKVEMIARGQEVDPRAPADPAALRRYLDDRLLALKSRVFRDYAEGSLRRESLLSGIISLVNDTRNSLDRIATATATAPAAAHALPEKKLESGKDARDARN
jgi:TRAP-type uncharacterized transport system substrate-binding protein